MLQIGLIAFTSPLALAGLLALPFIWRLLRTAPPPAARRRFPPVTLLTGLKDTESLPDRSPLWLRIIRLCAISSAILGLAGPVYDAEHSAGDVSGEPALVLIDGGWASSTDWEERLNKTEELLEELERRERIVAFAHIADPEKFRAQFKSATGWLGELSELSPKPWEPDFDGIADLIETEMPSAFDSFWISDGLHSGEKSELAQILSGRGNVTVYESSNAILALRRPELDSGSVRIRVSRSNGAGALAVVDAIGADASGNERKLDSAAAEFADGETEAEARFSLPTEILNRTSRFEIRGVRSAGAVILAADSVSRRKVALLDRSEADETSALLSPYHYLRQALETNAELISIPSGNDLSANPDVVVLADTPVFSRREAESLLDWLAEGGLLVRFAGPRLAAAAAERDFDDPLLPVRIRAGSRDVGGTLSWELPKRLAFIQGRQPILRFGRAGRSRNRVASARPAGAGSFRPGDRGTGGRHPFGNSQACRAGPCRALPRIGRRGMVQPPSFWLVRRNA